MPTQQSSHVSVSPLYLLILSLHLHFSLNKELMCVNIYDVRLEDTYPSCGMNWPPTIHNVTSYLSRKDVINAFHASAQSTSWVECRGRIHQEFIEPPSNSSITVLPSVLDRGIPVMLFVGDRDFICNYVGMEGLIKEMTWNGRKGLGTVKTESWVVDGTPAGTWVESRNLTYVKVSILMHSVQYPNLSYSRSSTHHTWHHSTSPISRMT